MDTEGDKAEVKGMIQSLYRYAGVHPVWNGEANESVAEVFNHYLSGVSFTCARAVVYKWGRELDMASSGLVLGRLPQWA